MFISVDLCPIPGVHRPADGILRGNRGLWFKRKEVYPAMLGIRFMKVPPSTYLLHYKNGKIKREGAGLSFFYYSATSSIVALPAASADVPFVFQELTSDYQEVTIQGQLTYRVTDPKRLAGLLNFTVDAGGKFICDDPDVLKQRLVQATQILTRTFTQRAPLRQVLTSSDAMVPEVLAGLRASDSVAMLGVEIMGFGILSIKPTPEMARALEAEAREALQGRADEAIYARRNAAVEQERRIKESELNTEIAVEEKRRQIRETQMAAEIAVEKQRVTLIDQRIENDRKEAESRAHALEATLKPVRDMDWRTLMAVSAGAADPGVLMSMAFHELAQNAQKIGELNITPDLLRALLPRKKEE